jgi:hypothetical protein
MTSSEGTQKKRFLGREDAVFLIDQFNKYSSWANQDAVFFYSTIAVTMAIIATIVSLMTPFGPNQLANLLLAITLMVALFILFGYRRIVTGVHEKNLEKLSLLVDYFIKHNSLPADLTFEKILKPLRDWKHLLVAQS